VSPDRQPDLAAAWPSLAFELAYLYDAAAADGRSHQGAGGELLTQVSLYIDLSVGKVTGVTRWPDPFARAKPGWREWRPIKLTLDDIVELRGSIDDCSGEEATGRLEAAQLRLALKGALLAVENGATPDELRRIVRHALTRAGIQE
jgi:hypothetical protein